MMQPAFSKKVFAFVSALALIGVPAPASARHTGGSKVGGSHAGGSHGGGHSSFKGGGHFSGGSRGSGRVSSARMGGGFKGSGRTKGVWSAKSGGFSSLPSSNFARSSNWGRGSSGFSTEARNYGRFGSSELAAQGGRASMNKWQSFGNSGGRSMLASAHISGNATGGWHTFGNFSRTGGAETSRSNGNFGRNESQWHAFGNSRSSSFARNSSEFSFFGGNHATGSNSRLSGEGLSLHRFSSNASASTRFSSSTSFSSGRPFGNFGESRFGGSSFGNFGFGNSAFGASGFSNSGIGSGVSLFPNLLGGILGLGTFGIKGPGMLAANALSLAVQLFVSAIGSNGFGQGDSAGEDPGFGPSGFSGNFGYEAAPVWPACGPGAPLWAPSPTPVAYCGQYAYRPYGGSSTGYVSGSGFGSDYR
jgi:hypothetical protein